MIIVDKETNTRWRVLFNGDRDGDTHARVWQECPAPIPWYRRRWRPVARYGFNLVWQLARTVSDEGFGIAGLSYRWLRAQPPTYVLHLAAALIDDTKTPSAWEKTGTRFDE